MLVKLAWRNIWRNRRRTVITLAAIFLAVVLSAMMMSLKEGVYESMIDTAVGDYMGYVKVNGNGYWEEKSLDYAMEYPDSVKDMLQNTKGVSGVVPRIESFALAVSDEFTKGSLVVGADPEIEEEFNQLSERVVDGEYFGPDDKSVLVGQGLADYLKVKPGDTLVLLGQGYHAASAAGKYPIAGIVKFGSPELSKQLIFLPLKEAQWLYNMPQLYTSLILQFKNPDLSKEVSVELRDKLSEEYEVLHWEEHNKELKDMIAADKVEGWVFMFILYLVISFGIFSTVLMMLQERKHEFGVLIAVGMKRKLLASMVLIETVFISLLGALCGMIGAFPVTLYFNLNPIEFSEEMADIYEEYGMEAVLGTSLDPSIFIQQGTIVAIVACVIALYPYFKITRMRAITAMNS